MKILNTLLLFLFRYFWKMNLKMSWKFAEQEVTGNWNWYFVNILYIVYKVHFKLVWCEKSRLVRNFPISCTPEYYIFRGARNCEISCRTAFLTYEMDFSNYFTDSQYKKAIWPICYEESRLVYFTTRIWKILVVGCNNKTTHCATFFGWFSLGF